MMRRSKEEYPLTRTSPDQHLFVREKDGAYILDTGIAAYAHAAAGPEYEYPACLEASISSLSTRSWGRNTYGPIKALHLSIGGW
jgi:hypothetical protein